MLRAAGRCYRILRNYHSSRCISNSVGRYSCRKFDNDVLVYKQCTYRFSTSLESCKTSRSEVYALSVFIRSSLNELEGPSHWWLNRSDVTKDIGARDGVFLVVAGAFVEDSSLMFEKVKSVQQRYPSLNVIGFQLCAEGSSDAVRSRLAKIVMREYITFPILVSNKSVSEVADRAGYILFKGTEGPLLLHDKDVESEILETAIKDLIVETKEKPGLLHNLRGTWVKPLDAFKEPRLCSPLQNSLLYFPGCIEVDEVNGLFFLSDTNHHRIIVFASNGEILDSIGSSPGFEDGEFESSKIMRPAALLYDDAEDSLYFVDSENHAIRRADMESRTVETFYPKPIVHETKSGPFSWIMDKLWSKRDVPSDSEEVDSKLLFYPWHLLKSVENELFVLNRSFETLWIIDMSSGLLKEVVKGFANIMEICGPLIQEKSSLLKEIPSSSLPQHIATKFSVEGISHAGLVSSVATFQGNIVICDSDGQVVLKYNKKSQAMSSFEFSKFGILGLPYWLVSPMESAYAAGFGVPGVHVDHIQHFSLLPGRINIQMKVEIPEDTELVEPLDEGCIWRQTRGTATEILGAENKAESTEKVGVAQQWYDELDELASLTEQELKAEEDQVSDAKVQDGKICIDCAVDTSPGTSEVIINAALYLRIKKLQNQKDDSKKLQATRLASLLNPSGIDKVKTDACAQILLTSEKTPEEFVFLRPLHVRLKINSRDHPKAENSKDIILTESSIEVNVSLK
ncbi:NHL domain-containing protein [Artemisia annua]|uniref:NHL domain-containing protein n=1 Tax=Artemisia annua TaxID=35608 RepID=A0A2U1P105_ARTAN|nr:NHL domain-containing protein [Artemisia annua]